MELRGKRIVRPYWLVVLASTLALAGCGSGTTTVTQTRTVTPVACSHALEDAHNLAGIVGAAFGHAGEYLPLIERAAKAGAASDVPAAEGIASEEGQITARIHRDTGDVSREVTAFKSDAAACEAGVP
jgi:hypothetical protein